MSEVPERIDEPEVLQRAADILERTGWRQMSQSAAGTSRLTVPEAINQAILQRYAGIGELDLPARRQIVAERMDAEHQLACWLLDAGQVPKRWESRFSFDHIVLEWNERSDQREAQVVAGLRSAAAMRTAASA